MSYDLLIVRFCDHLQVEERQLEPDGQTIKLLNPMSNSILTRLFRNEEEVQVDDPIYGWSTRVDPTASSDWYNQSIPYSLIASRKSIYLNLSQDERYTYSQNTSGYSYNLSLDDEWRIQYQTIPTMCVKCHNLQVIDDIVWKTGRLQTVTDAEKLAQELKKIALTLKGSSIFHPWYGTYFIKYIGTGQGSTVTSRLYGELQSAIANMIDLQNQQIQFQYLSNGERIKRLVSMNISRMTEDPTLIRVDVFIETQASEVVNLTTLVSMRQNSLYFGNVNFLS